MRKDLICRYRYNIELPVELSAEQQGKLDFMRSDGIDELDYLYLKQVVQDHKDWENGLTDVIANTQVDTIMNYARKIKMHQFRHMERAERMLSEEEPTS